MESSYTINFSVAEDISFVSAIVLEQKEWELNNRFTKGMLYAYLNNYLSALSTMGAIRAVGQGSIPIAEFDCGVDSNKTVKTTIYAYPMIKDLVYRLKTSYGNLLGRKVTNTLWSESIQFDGNGAVKTKLARLPIGNVQYSWIGDIFDSNGNNTLPPSVTIIDSTVSISKAVYGTLTLNYTVERHEYELNVTARSGESSDLFGAVVYALYNGGLEFLELETPPLADELANGDATCISGLTVEDNLVPEDEFVPPTEAPKVDKTQTYDYCDGTILNESVTYT